MRILALALAALTLLWPSLADAAVRIDFRSRDTDTRVPHGFVTVSGTLDATGEEVKGSYGWTLGVPISPIVLTTPVEGLVYSVKDKDIAKSNLHFSLVLTDAEYESVLALIKEWEALPQPSYRLFSRNCVTFLSALATRLGLEAAIPSGLELKPHSFLDSVLERNRPLIVARAPSEAPATTTAAAEAAPAPQ